MQKNVESIRLTLAYYNTSKHTIRLQVAIIWPSTVKALIAYEF